MFYKFLERNDVLEFISELCTNKRYFLKKIQHTESFLFSITDKLALYIFYDALYKYQVIIDDIFLFDDYLLQRKKLYRKIDNFEDIRIGINKLLCRMLSSKLSINDVNNAESRKKIVSYVYEKYIVDGYFIHGFVPYYYDYLEKNSFVPEKYQNYYDSFAKIDAIFKKYTGKQIILKDFYADKVFFTDDFVMGCYYSLYAPMFFYEFLSNRIFGKGIKIEPSFIYDYDKLTFYLKKYMSNNLFSEVDRNVILDIVRKQWNLLKDNKNKITLLLVKRKKIFINETLLDEYLNSEAMTYEVVDRILSSKYSSIPSNSVLVKSDFELITVDSYCSKSYNKKNDDYQKHDDSINVLDKHGTVSTLLLLGSLLISLGVISTIISVLGR